MRCLLKQNEASIEQMNAIVSTCCVLHNIFQVHKETFAIALMEQCSNYDEPNLVGRNRQGTAIAAANIRDALVKYYTENKIGQY